MESHRSPLCTFWTWLLPYQPSPSHNLLLNSACVHLSIIKRVGVPEQLQPRTGRTSGRRESSQAMCSCTDVAATEAHSCSHAPSSKDIWRSICLPNTHACSFFLACLFPSLVDTRQGLYYWTISLALTFVFQVIFTSSTLLHVFICFACVNLHMNHGVSVEAERPPLSLRHSGCWTWTWWQVPLSAQSSCQPRFLNIILRKSLTKVFRLAWSPSVVCCELGLPIFLP